MEGDEAGGEYAHRTAASIDAPHTIKRKLACQQSTKELLLGAYPRGWCMRLCFHAPAMGLGREIMLQ